MPNDEIKENGANEPRMLSPQDQAVLEAFNRNEEDLDKLRAIFAQDINFEAVVAHIGGDVNKLNVGGRTLLDIATYGAPPIEEYKI